MSSLELFAIFPALESMSINPFGVVPAASSYVEYALIWATLYLSPKYNFLAFLFSGYEASEFSLFIPYVT